MDNIENNKMCSKGLIYLQSAIGSLWFPISSMLRSLQRPLKFRPYDIHR